MYSSPKLGEVPVRAEGYINISPYITKLYNSDYFFDTMLQPVLFISEILFNFVVLNGILP